MKSAGPSKLIQPSEPAATVDAVDPGEAGKAIEVEELGEGSGLMRRVEVGRTAGTKKLWFVPAALVGLILVVLVSWAAAVLLWSSPSRTASPEPGGSGPVVLISGRDDHGLVQEALVPLFGAPDSSAVVARTRDGSFGRVVEERGEWLRVQVLGNSGAVGWVNDFYLRRRVLRTSSGGGQETQVEQVELVELVDAREEEGGQVWVEVRSVGEAQATPVWLRSSVLREIGAHNDR